MLGINSDIIMKSIRLHTKCENYEKSLIILAKLLTFHELNLTLYIKEVKKLREWFAKKAKVCKCINDIIS